MLSRDTVETAFRLILGRPPESETAIEAHRPLPDAATLRRVLIASPEFARHYAEISAAPPGEAAPAGDGAAAEPPGEAPAFDEEQGILRPLAPIEIAAEGAEADRLWTRVAESWRALGEEAAHWSVLTHDRFRPERLDAHREEFVRSGEVEGKLVDAALARLPDFDAASADCMEIGCGVGRATRALARRFRHVTGVDVSPGHLAFAEADFAAEGLTNATFRRVGAVGDYATLPETDFFYSRIVLQHNPPPVQAAILAAALGRLRPGGIALFQVVTDIGGYSYSVAADLAREERAMEMHALPQPAVFALLAEAGLAPVEVQEDFAAGDAAHLRSHLFLARKAGAGKGLPTGESG